MAAKKLAAVQPIEWKPAGRLLELMRETNTVEPYEAFDGVSIYPPTKRASKVIDAAQMTIYISQAALSEALQRANEKQPEHPGVDATPEQVAAWETAIQAWKTRKLAGEDDMAALNTKIGEATQESDRAFFGPAYDALMEFFEDQPKTYWDKFVADINAHFAPALPDDGVCPHCGHVDEETAGKDSAPST